MTHTWKIYDLKRTIIDGVITEITYACESNHNEVNTRTIGEVTIEGSASDADFINFDDLTQDDVLGWLDSIISKPTIETLNATTLNNRIAEQSAITESNGTPW